MLIGVFIPEMMCLKAFFEIYTARKLVKLLAQNHFGKHSLKQAHYLLWGGIRIKHGQAFLKNSVVNSRILHGKTLKHEGRKLLELLTRNVPIDDHIDERSKADVVTKVITCFQATWVAFQLVARLVLRLDLSLLEVVTATYILLAMLAYIAWWSKPYDMQRSVQVQLPADMIHATYTSIPQTQESAWIGFDFTFLQMDDPNNNKRWKIPLLFILFIVLAGIHCAAWNYSFPTNLEAWAWRVSALVPPGVLLILSPTNVENTITENYAQSKTAPWYKKMWIWWSWALLGTTYIAARLFITVEIFYSFRSAPAGIYEQLAWSHYVGHIGS